MLWLGGLLENDKSRYSPVVKEIRDKRVTASGSIDIAMTETAREADYVLPAASQFEKAEASFFNFEPEANAFHLRRPLFPPREGTLEEGAIHARLCAALGAFGEAEIAPLGAAAQQSPSTRGAWRHPQQIVLPWFSGFRVF